MPEKVGGKAKDLPQLSNEHCESRVVDFKPGGRVQIASIDQPGASEASTKALPSEAHVLADLTGSERLY
jgi:hypothetical protein